MNPGMPHAAVIQPSRRPRPPPERSPRALSAFGRFCWRIASASSTSPRARRAESGFCGSVPSGPEELDILLLPRDADLLPLPATQIGVALAGHLREHPLAAGGEVQLDEVAEELDEDDLGLDRVAGGSLCIVELDGRSADRDLRRVADRRRHTAVDSGRD